VRSSQPRGWIGQRLPLRAGAIVFVALVVIAVMAGLASSAQAATYTVGTSSDTARGVACDQGPASGTCSLRQLIEYEDALEKTPNPPDIIEVPSGTYELLYGTLTITQSLVIVGAGARTTTVDIPADSNRERVFITQSPTESAVGIFGLKIAGGTAEADENKYSDFGGDVRNTGSLVLSEDWVTEGTASGGAGIANDAGTLVLERSLVSDNHASIGSGEAGGIQNYGSEKCVSACGEIGTKAVLALEDSTVADNVAGLGAGIVSATEGDVADENEVSIIDSTIAGNEMEESCSIECFIRGGGAGLRAEEGTISVGGSIVADNTETDLGGTTNTNCSATSPATIISPLGYDIENGTDCGFTSTEDKQNTSPDFSSSTPQDNGGSTNTFALEPASPAVDAIPKSVSLLCDNLDQRGVTRPQGAGCDIGAFELAPSTFQATGVPVSATAGTQFSGTVATFTEAVPDIVASDYTATIEWGDGTSSAGIITPASGGGFAVSCAHTYAAGGTFAISVKITDVQGATATATSTATVAGPPGSPAPPTVIATSPPAVLSTTSAAFTTTVNPEGLATEVHFEYGPVLPGATASAITYGSVTPDQTVGSDFTNHTVTATVTGLLPNVTYHWRAVATNSAGSALGADQILVTPADPPPPPPVLGKAVNVTPVSGIVYIELPPGATLAAFSPFSPFALAAQAPAALTKGRSFIPLTEARQIPVGSILDTNTGVVGITTATTASKKGKLQSGDFGAGIFKLLQGRKQKGLTDLDIINNFSAHKVCATLGKARISSRHPSSKVLGRLNASGHGNFTARGQYSAATVRGTVWSVTNQCDGTLTHVKRGVVSVRDFRRRKTITLFTGESYLARAPHS
jgi:hypothetical protein